MIITTSLGFKYQLKPTSAFRFIHVTHTEVSERHMHNPEFGSLPEILVDQCSVRALRW